MSVASLPGAPMSAASPPGAHVNTVQNSLVNAPDAQLARIVAMVDAIPVRGAADALIAPLRPRLALLRPARKMQLTRLLFSPLNPLIVPLRAWRRGDVGVARSNLPPLSTAVRAALPDLCREVDDALLAISPGDGSALLSLGARLWPEAAAMLLSVALQVVFPDALDAAQPRCRTRSARAQAHVGVASVAEGCALAAAGPEGRLVLARIASGGVTCALAQGPGVP